MSTLAAQTYLTPAEYINAERKAVTKSEYLNGADSSDVGREQRPQYHYDEYIKSILQPIGGPGLSRLRQRYARSGARTRLLLLSG